MSYLNSVTLVGFVGSDPEQRQAKGNGSKFAVLSVATQRSWKNADDEWSSKTDWHRVVVFRPRLADVFGEPRAEHEDAVPLGLRRPLVVGVFPRPLRCD
jgi:single stranded DNA-binding protein